MHQPTPRMLWIVIAIGVVAGITLTIATDLMEEGLKTSPFEALRWNDDTPEVRIQRVWYRPVAIQGVDVDDVLAFCKKQYGSRLQKRFSEDLPAAMKAMGHPLPERVDLKLVRLEDGVEVTLTDVPSTERNRKAILKGNRGRSKDRNAQQQPSRSFFEYLFPFWRDGPQERGRQNVRKEVENEADIAWGTTPFEALRWKDDAPEVMVQSVWYRPVAIQGIDVADVLASCKQWEGSRFKKRFGEDLPTVMQMMGHALTDPVELKLVRVDDGVEVTLTDVPSTRSNRTAIWTANRKARNGNRNTIYPQSSRIREGQPRISGQISREDALADLAELQERLDDQFAYRNLRDIDLQAELERIQQSLGNEVTIKELTWQLHELMMTFGDGHASVRSDDMEPYGMYTPFLLEDASDGVVAFMPDRRGFLDARRPYILAIDGYPIEDLIEAVRPMIAAGSPQLVRSRALRYLRFNQLVTRMLLGVRQTCCDITCTLATGPQDPEPVDIQIEWAGERPIYGQWPRMESEIIDGTIGYLRIEEMDGRLVQRIQRDMDAYRDTEGLIIDVRGNGGGTRLPLITLAGYLLGPDESPWVGNVARYRLSDQFEPDHLNARYMYRADDPRWSDAQRQAIMTLASQFTPEWDDPEGFSQWHYLVLDRTGSDSEYFYDKPVVILSDANCFSATDIFLGALSGRPNITLMGSASGGGSARSQRFTLPNSGIEIRCASMASFRPDGRLYDGRGVEVDIEVFPEPHDLLSSGHDSVLDAAIKHLRSK